MNAEGREIIYRTISRDEVVNIRFMTRGRVRNISDKRIGTDECATLVLYSYRDVARSLQAEIRPFILP